MLVGEKVTFTRFELPGANTNGPVPVAENGAPAGPLTLPSSMPLPWFLIFTVALA
jgi:hypothetical protein